MLGKDSAISGRDNSEYHSFCLNEKRVSWKDGDIGDIFVIPARPLPVVRPVEDDFIPTLVLPQITVLQTVV